MAVPPDGVAEVVSRSIEILSVFKSKVALLGNVNCMIEVGPAEVAPLVSKTKRLRLNPVRAAVAKATSLGITSILIRSQNKIILRGVAKFIRARKGSLRGACASTVIDGGRVLWFVQNAMAGFGRWPLLRGEDVKA